MYFTRREVGPYTYLCYSLLSEDCINYQKQMINKSDQTGFIKSTLRNNEMEFDVTSLVPIELYFKNHCMTYETQKHMFKKVIDSLWMSEKYLLDTRRIVLEKEYIFVEPTDLDIKLLYIPSKKYSISIHKALKDVFLSLLFSIQLNVMENDTRIKRVVTYLQDPEFDIMIFASMMNTLQKPIKKNRKEWFKKIFIKEATEKGMPIEVVDGTILLSQEKSFPILEFKEKSVIVNKESFLIGRAKQLVDYAIPEALSLGRVHAELITEEDGYYIVDINTKNGTFLNGERLKSQKKYPLCRGDAIQIANEKAVFK